MPVKVTVNLIVKGVSVWSSRVHLNTNDHLVLEEDIESSLEYIVGNIQKSIDKQYVTKVNLTEISRAYRNTLKGVYRSKCSKQDTTNKKFTFGLNTYLQYRVKPVDSDKDKYY